jgi:hypothetical protein
MIAVRQPRGTPNGGQFAPQANPEPDLDLDPAGMLSGKQAVESIFPDGESQRRRRGHKFLRQSDVEATPPLYSGEEIPFPDKVVTLHYFSSNCDWYVAELDRETGLAFGHCDLGMGFPEWGYVDLRELEGVATRWGPVERDCYFTPGRAADRIAAVSSDADR